MSDAIMRESNVDFKTTAKLPTEKHLMVNKSLLMRPLLYSEDEPAIAANPQLVPPPNSYHFMLSGNDSGMFACPTCGMEHTTAHSKVLKQMDTDLWNLRSNNNAVPRLLARVRFHAEDGVEWCHHIVEPPDVFSYIPLAISVAASSGGTPIPSDFTSKLGMIYSHFINLSKTTNDKKQTASQDVKSLASGVATTKRVPDFHLVLCDCGERKCCGYLLYHVDECLHCTTKPLAKSKCPALANRLDNLRLMKPSELRTLILQPLPNPTPTIATAK
jgi:hypothetical protein